MKEIKLYDVLDADKMDKFLQSMGSSLEVEQPIEIKNKEEDFYGDFIVSGGYKFKICYGNYSCMETPTDKHKPAKLMAKKAPNDHYNWGR